MFEYNPGEIAELRPDHRWGQRVISRTSAHRRRTPSSSVREEFEGKGGGNFEQAQMLINSGIDEGVEVCNRHSSTVMHVLDEMVNTDIAAGNSFGFGG